MLICRWCLHHVTVASGESLLVVLMMSSCCLCFRHCSWSSCSVKLPTPLTSPPSKWIVNAIFLVALIPISIFCVLVTLLIKILDCWKQLSGVLLHSWVGSCYTAEWGLATQLSGVLLHSWVGSCYTAEWGLATQLSGVLLHSWVGSCYTAEWGLATQLSGVLLHSWVGSCYTWGRLIHTLQYIHACIYIFF